MSRERAYPPGRVYRAVPAHKSRAPAFGRDVAARNQTRRLPGHRPQERHAQVRLYSRPGKDLTYRFPLIVETVCRSARVRLTVRGAVLTGCLPAQACTVEEPGLCGREAGGRGRLG